MSSEPRALTPASAAAEFVRLCLSGDGVQIDLSLPLDVPVALLIPEMLRLVSAHQPERPTGAGNSLSEQSQRDVWVLRQGRSAEPVPPDSTLREAAVVDGQLLKLTSRRALTAPTLYDDVVDATARLNRAGYAAWSDVAARRVAFAGVQLASVAWVCVLLSHRHATSRSALLGLAAFAVLALLGAAVVAARSAGQPDAGAVLGWATLPIAATATWVGLSRFGCFAMAGVFAALVVLCAAQFRAIGSGQWGFVTAAVLFGVGSVAAALRGLGVPALWIAVGLAAVVVGGCVTLPPLLTGKLRRAATVQSRAADASQTSGPPDAADIFRRVEIATLIRAGLYSGLAAAAAAAAAWVLRAASPTSWPALTFALVCAAALAAHSRLLLTAVERAALLVPASALLVVAVYSCAAASMQAMTAYGLLLAAVAGLAAAGTFNRAVADMPAALVLLSYQRYLALGALIPSGLWALGALSATGPQ